MRERLAGRQRFDQRARVAGANPDVGELLLVDRRQQLGDAVDEGLAADEADVRLFARPGGQMLAAAEADLEPEFAGANGRTGSRPRARPVDLEPRQQFGHEPRVIGAQRLALAAPVERPTLDRVGRGVRLRSAPSSRHDQARRANWSARSVFSQEKPPSASGARPKWP